MEIILKNIKSAKKNLEILEDDKFIKEINNFSIEAIKTLKKKKINFLWKWWFGIG